MLLRTRNCNLLKLRAEQKLWMQTGLSFQRVLTNTVICYHRPDDWCSSRVCYGSWSGYRAVSSVSPSQCRGSALTLPPPPNSDFHLLKIHGRIPFTYSGNVHDPCMAGFDSRQAGRPALGPIQPSIPCVHRYSGSGHEADHSPPSTADVNVWSSHRPTPASP
jgi:hypothetical protein